MPNLQQYSTDATSFINDTINTEWVSLMTSMNLGEVGDVDDSTESRSVNLPTIVIYITAVQNPMKMSDISFLKTKLN